MFLSYRGMEFFIAAFFRLDFRKILYFLFFTMQQKTLAQHLANGDPKVVENNSIFRIFDLKPPLTSI